MTSRLNISLLAIAVWPLIARAAAPDAGLRFFEDRVQRDPEDFIAWNQLATRYHTQLRRTGEMRFLTLETKAAEKSLEIIPADQNPDGLAALAQARLAAHRFAEARDAARQLRVQEPGKVRPLELLTDALIELGEYEEAGRVCRELGAMEGVESSVLPREARLDLIHGRVEKARERLENGLGMVGELPELVAWYRVQLGALAFRQGRWEEAEKHYDAAAGALPDYYSVTDHFAELRAAQGRHAEAIALYEKLIARLPRPEFLQALGDICVLAKQPETAAAWHAKAEAAYLASVAQDETHYFHHLAGFYADSREEPAKAVEWARKDLTLRQSIFAHDALAWALYKSGQAAEALAASQKALATGSRDPHLLYHASLIRMAAGDIPGGKAALQQATEINPRFNTFHVHR